MFDRADSTMILQTGQEINELESSGFHTEGPTVFCGNISASANGDSGNNYIVQVAKSGSVRLLLGADRLIQNLDLGLTVKRASLASPHLLVMSDRGDLVLVTLEVSHKVNSSWFIYGAGQKSGP